MKELWWAHHDELVQVDVLREGHAGRVDLEDHLLGLLVRQRDAEPF